LSFMHSSSMHPSACLNIIRHEWNAANMKFFNLFSGISEEFLNIPHKGQCHSQLASSFCDCRV
jgi:hypothetical protein